MYFLNRGTKTVTFENLDLVIKTTADFIFPILVQTLVIVSLFVGIAAIAVILFTSHKIAGPLYRLTLELKKLKMKDLSTPIHIRADDQLQKVASEFEEMRSNFRVSLDFLKKNWLGIRSEFVSLKNAIQDENQKKRLEEKIVAIDAEFARFKTE